MSKMSKSLFTLFLITALGLATAQISQASLRCTISCLAEDDGCNESPEVCALLFEACVEICEHPEDFEGPAFSPPAGLIFNPSAGLIFDPAAISMPPAE